VKSRPASIVEHHVEPQFETGAIESTPQVRTDVVRESDKSAEPELPETGKIFFIIELPETGKIFFIISA